MKAIIDSLNILADSYLLEYLRVFEYFVKGISRNLDLLFVVGFLAVFETLFLSLSPYSLTHSQILIDSWIV